MLYPEHMAYKDRYPFRRRALTGSYYQHHTGDFHSYRFAVNGYFDWRNWAIARAVCRPGDTIVDIGANVGTETVGFSDLVGATGTVWAFEPFPANVQVLEQVAAGLRFRNVRIVPCALGDAARSASFSVPRVPATSGTGFVLPESSDEPGVQVDVRTLDSMAARIGSARAVFMDVEGSELRVLRGGAGFFREHRPILVLEASPTCLARSGSSLRDLANELWALGYEPHPIGRYGLTELSFERRAAGNWLCVPHDERTVLRQAVRILRWAMLAPCVPLLHPLVRR